MISENNLVKLMRGISNILLHTVKAIEQYESPPPDVVEKLIDKKKSKFQLPFVSRKKANQMQYKAIQLTQKDLNFKHSEEMKKAMNREPVANGSNQDDEIKMILGSDFASMNMLAASDYTENYLANRNTKFAKSIEKDFIEAFGVTELDEIKDTKKKEKLLKALESSRRVWAGVFGAYGLFAGADYDFQFSTLSEIRRQSMMRYHIDGHISGFVSSILSYIIGTGLKFKCVDPQCQEYLENKYWKFNKMETFHKDRVLKALLMGEQFAVYNDTQNNKYTVVHEIEPDLIPEIESEGRFRLAYKEVDENDKLIGWHLDIDYENHKLKDLESEYETKAEGKGPVHHMKIGLGERGKPITLPVLRYAQYYEDFVRDCQRHWHEQARCIFVKTVSANNPDYDEAGGIFPSPSGGLMLVAVKDEMEYDFKSPQLNSGGAEVLSRILRMSISTAFRTPEVVGFVDASEAVYASIKTTMNPFTFMILDYQDIVKEWHGIEARYFLRKGVERGDLPETVTVRLYDKDRVSEAAQYVFTANESIKAMSEKVEGILGEPEEKEVSTVEVPIEFILPDVIEQNIKELTDAYKVHDEMGWSHKSLISTKLGWPYQLVKALREMDRQEKMNQDDELRDRINQGASSGEPKNKNEDPEDEE